MKNSKLRRALLLVACAVLLVSISVSATLAYLTSKTGVVTNTFSVGNVTITLDEALVGEDGKKVTGENARRVTENEYHLLPGKQYDKDPIVHVDENSEACWLFIKVVNGIADIEVSYPKIANQIVDNEWDPMPSIEGIDTSNMYFYPTIVQPGVDVPVFQNFEIDGTKVNNTILANYDGATITVQAYAIQADGFTRAVQAYTTSPCTWGEETTGGTTEDTTDETTGDETTGA